MIGRGLSENLLPFHSQLCDSFPVSNATQSVHLNLGYPSSVPKGLKWNRCRRHCLHTISDVQKLRVATCYRSSNQSFLVAFSASSELHQHIESQFLKKFSKSFSEISPVSCSLECETKGFKGQGCQPHAQPGYTLRYWVAQAPRGRHTFSSTFTHK
ncbi:hypothetical protein CEXT_800661 [Caerostris extrusa]|uniref:Uncharacterized protein n=1 Tax=Caerostris extrusa TaxID=172846 RepID=A0AAV4Q0W7_CAEEX|nr:hypothetical protein CEXT_800661 [Caerostris extrusa]